MAAQRSPNIVLILTDDHAAHAVGAYGSVVNRTPRIDEIAAHGAVLENCFATNALCSPSRASILTGKHSHLNGVYTLDTPIDASQSTFVSQLKAVGYRTAIIGKWHLGDGDGHDPQSFDYWDVLIEQGEYFEPKFLSEEGIRVEPGYVTDIITDLALDWLESIDDEQPWCLLINHKAPHRSWEPDERHAGMYRDIPVPETFFDDYSSRSSSARRAAMRIAEHLNSADLKQPVPSGLTYEEESLWKYQRYMEDYLACVASVDDNVGRVIDWLRERQCYDHTLMMYTSDQGFFLGDHGWFDKRLMYEEALRMPFVLSYPDSVPAGQRHSGIVTNVDLASTILEAAGVESYEGIQGRSFWNDISGIGETTPPSDGMYYRYWEHGDRFHNAPGHYGYRSERYKLIYFYNDGMGVPGADVTTYEGSTHAPDWELYDLVDDPEELSNVYDDPAYRRTREEMKVRLWRAQAEVGDVPHPSQAVPEMLAQDS